MLPAAAATSTKSAESWDAYLTADNVVTFASAVLATVLGAVIAPVVAVKAYKGQQQGSRRQ